MSALSPGVRTSSLLVTLLTAFVSLPSYVNRLPDVRVPLMLVFRSAGAWLLWHHCA